MSSFVCSDMFCPLIWWSKYLRSCPSKLFRFHYLKFFKKFFFPIFFFLNVKGFCVYWRHLLSRLLREPQGIIACCNPVPPLVRQQVNELHLLVQQAREMPLLKVRIDGSSRNVVFAITCQSVSHNCFFPPSPFRLRLQLRRRKDSHLLKRLAQIVKKSGGLFSFLYLSSWSRSVWSNSNILVTFSARSHIVWPTWYVQGFWEWTASLHTWW